MAIQAKWLEEVLRKWLGIDAKPLTNSWIDADGTVFTSQCHAIGTNNKQMRLMMHRPLSSGNRMQSAPVTNKDDAIKALADLDKRYAERDNYLRSSKPHDDQKTTRAGQRVTRNYSH